MTTPPYVDAVQWHHCLGFSRQACARVFRDGGTARDALCAFGLDAAPIAPTDWARAVDLVATALCRAPHGRRARAQTA